MRHIKLISKLKHQGPKMSSKSLHALYCKETNTYPTKTSLDSHLHRFTRDGVAMNKGRWEDDEKVAFLEVSLENPTKK
jgi:hypothetical protein